MFIIKQTGSKIFDRIFAIVITILLHPYELYQ